MRPIVILAALLLGLGHGVAAAALQVFACEPEWAALARELGGERLEIFTATTAQQDPHRIQPRPSLIARFRQADLAVCTGAELESAWLPVLAQTAGNPRLQPGKPGWFEAAGAVQLIEVPTSLDRAHGDVHPAGNPHFVTDPRNIARVASALATRLVQVDPGGAAAYQARAADFAARWSQAVEAWAALGAPLAGLRVIAYHREFSYLFAWLGIETVGTLEPKPGLPPSAGHLESLLALHRQRPAQLIVRSAHQSTRAADWLATRAGLASVQLPYTVGGAPGVDDLFALYRETLERLRTGLPAP